MADEIKLKAPTVEQQVVVNIQGEEKLRSFADTLEKISSNKNLQKYWKTQQELINDTTDAYNNFSKKASQDNAKELIKVTNALKAMAGTDLSGVLPDFDKIAKSMSEAKKVAGNIDSAFSVKGFKEAFDSFEMLKAYGVDIQNFFSHFGVSADVGQLQKNVRALEDEVGKLTRRLSNAKNANEELRNEFENFKTGSGFADKLDELDNLKSEMSYLRDQAEETFRQFLKLNNVSEDGYDRDGFYDDNRFREYFKNIQSGYMSASDAIRQFKTEYSYLLEESFKTNNDTFGLEQLQAFSNKLDSIFRQVEDASSKINDIISNGVLTKSVENLSVDSSLSDSQRSLFGNLLKDEESLKSITALFQKLIEESNKTKNNELFNSEQLQQVLSVFDRIENTLSSLRSIISDVGDGEEFSPLLKMINNVQTSISELSTSVKGIGLNMNIDVGSDGELDRKLQSKIANALQAYQKLFNNIKMSSAGGSFINQAFFDFNLDDYDTAYQKLQAIVNFVKKQRAEAKKQFNGYDALYEDSDKSLWKSAQSYLAQVTKAETEIKKANSSESNPLENLFDNTTDLSGVIEQLNKVVEKLNEISSSATEFKNIFKEGFNVTASVEEIDKLTNRVKELEDELSKVKLSPVSVDKSNISSENFIRSVLPSDSEFKNVIANLDLTKSKLGEIVKITKQAHADKDGKFYESFTLTDRNGSTETYGESSKTSKGQLLNYKYVEQNAKAAEQETKALNQAWEEANKVNNALNETKKTLSYLSRMTELDTQFTSLDAKLSSLNSELTSGKISVADYKKEVKSLTSEYSKLVTIQQNRDVETYKQNAKAAEQEAKAIKQLNDELEGYNNQIPKKPIDGQRSDYFEGFVQKYREAIDEARKYLDTLGNSPITEEVKKEWENLIDVIKKAKEEMDSVPTAERGSDALSRGKEIDTITKYLDKFTGISKQAKRELNGLLDQLQSGDPSVNVKKIHERFLELTVAERNAGREARNLFDIFKDKKIYSFLGQAASMFSFYDLIRYGREGIDTIREFDDGLTKISYTMDMTKSQLDNLGNSVLDMASDMKSSIDDAMQVAQIYANMQTSSEEIQRLSEPTLILSNLSGFDSSTIADDIQAVTQQFDILAEDSMHIADVYDYISRNIAVDYSKGLNAMAEGLQVAGSTAKQAGKLKDLNVQKCA